MILMLRNAQDLEEGQAHLQLPGIDGHGHGHGHGEEESINLKGAVIHVLGDLIQSLGVAAAGALIWWKQVRLWEIPFARLPCPARCFALQGSLSSALLCRRAVLPTLSTAAWTCCWHDWYELLVFSRETAACNAVCSMIEQHTYGLQLHLDCALKP